MEFEICKHKSVPRRFIVDTKEEGELVDGWMEGCQRKVRDIVIPILIQMQLDCGRSESLVNDTQELQICQKNSITLNTQKVLVPGDDGGGGLVTRLRESLRGPWMAVEK